MPEDSLFYRYGPPNGRWKPRAAPVPEKAPRDGRTVFYAIIWPHAIRAARSVGYALGLHGSLQNDMDIIAAPWTEDAGSPEELVQAIMKAVGGFVPGTVIGGRWTMVPGTPKPHGRQVWNVGYSGRTVMDLSVMPRVNAPPAGARSSTSRNRKARR